MSARASESYGQHGVSWVDRLGVWLSQRAIRRWLPPGSALDVLELGCGYRAKLLVGLRDRLRRGVGVDFQIDPALRELAPFEFHEGPIEQTLPLHDQIKSPFGNFIGAPHADRIPGLGGEPDGFFERKNPPDG